MMNSRSMVTCTAALGLAFTAAFLTDVSTAAAQTAVSGDSAGVTAPATAAPMAAAPMAAAPATAAPAPAAPSRSRANWYSDAVELEVGQIVTVIIDEATSAQESVNERGLDRRTVNANLSAVADGKKAIGATGLDSKWNADTQRDGQASRRGRLVGDVSARVVSLDRSGMAEIHGVKDVVIDGRQQEITVQGWVRPNDVWPSNTVHSSRLADARISYRGKSMGPKLGIIGRIVGMLWPF